MDENLANSTYFDREAELTGEQAAYLIVGTQRSDTPGLEFRHMLKKINEAYQHALRYYVELSASNNEWKWVAPDRPELDSQAIRSTTMQKLEGLLSGHLNSDWMGDPKGGTLEGWLTIGKTDFNGQKFGREELQRWIDDADIPSAYPFLGEPKPLPASHLEKVAPQPAVGTKWRLIKPKRYPGYRKPLYDFLNCARLAGKSCPTARDVLDAWKDAPPPEVQVMSDGLKYDSSTGKKTADLKAIQQAIKALMVTGQSNDRCKAV